MVALPSDVDVLVVGAGMGGMAAFRGLTARGIPGVHVIERAERVGGTWRDNTYPGCAVDVESHLYEFRDRPNPAWTRTFVGQPEIQDYLEETAAAWGMPDRTTFGCTLLCARWDPAARRWLVQTDRGDLRAGHVVAATGVLSEPRLPELPGIGEYPGRLVHTARWPADLDLQGSHVVVVGTGASAIQVVPGIAASVDSLTVVQRTPAWVLPRPETSIPGWVRDRLGRRPAVQRGYRGLLYGYRELLGRALRNDGRPLRVAEVLARRHLAASVADPGLREALTPDYRLGCKRVLLSNDFYPSLTRENVRLVPAAAVGFDRESVLTADGGRHRADVVVFATGFDVNHHPVAELIHGADGRSLAQVWQGSPSAYLGTMVAGFPNLFFLAGPNTGTGHTSVLLYEEAQVDHIGRVLTWMRENDVAAVDIHEQAQSQYNRVVQRLLGSTVWTRGGCASWYQADDGSIAALFPAGTGRFRSLSESFDPRRYRTMSASVRSPGDDGDAASGRTTPTDEPAMAPVTVVPEPPREVVPEPPRGDDEEP